MAEPLGEVLQGSWPPLLTQFLRTVWGSADIPFKSVVILGVGVGKTVAAGTSKREAQES